MEARESTHSGGPKKNSRFRPACAENAPEPLRFTQGKKPCRRRARNACVIFFDGARPQRLVDDLSLNHCMRRLKPGGIHDFRLMVLDLPEKAGSSPTHSTGFFQEAVSSAFRECFKTHVTCNKKTVGPSSQ